MLKSVEGTYRNGKVELAEQPSGVNDDTRVIVTFLRSGHLDLEASGIDRTTAAKLRTKLATFDEEWSNPEMDMYDEYETATTQP
jgi:hypothetical protein